MWPVYPGSVKCFLPFLYSMYAYTNIYAYIANYICIYVYFPIFYICKYKYKYIYRELKSSLYYATLSDLCLSKFNSYGFDKYLPPTYILL